MKVPNFILEYGQGQNRVVIICKEISIQRWQDHFHRVCNNVDAISIDEPSFFEDDDQDQPEPYVDNDILQEEIMKHIRHLRSAKSEGLDRVSEMLVNVC